VVDGQQRLASLLLLIRAAVEVLGDDETGRRLQNELINPKKIGDAEAEFVLTLSERDKYNFKSLLDDNVIYSPPSGAPGEKRYRQSSPARLIGVKEYFKERLQSILEEQGKGGVIRFIADNVLKLNFVEVQLEDDTDVFLFFETLNAKGVDLTIADLLKNHVCRIARDETETAKRIDEITNILGEGKMNSFLLHYCSALSEETIPPTKKSLMPWFTKTIEEEKDEFLIKLREYADIYSIFIDPKKAKTDQKEVVNFLKVLGATRCYPLLLVGYKYLPHSRDFLKLCKAVEILTFRHSTITGRDAKVLEKEYFDLSKLLKRGRAGQVFDRLSFLAGQISDEVFVTNFKEYEPATISIARYILLKIDNYLTKGSSSLDWDKLTLEHVLPQSPSREGKSDLCERLGNMTLLSGDLNKSVGNKDFNKKKEMYRSEERVKLTQLLAEYEEFTNDSIIERQSELAELALKVWSAN